jgi:hypothetical protein
MKFNNRKLFNIENIILLCVILSFFLTIIIVIWFFSQKVSSSSQYWIHYLPTQNQCQGQSQDIIGNPYVPPLKNERYIMQNDLSMPCIGKVPINISTNIGAVETQYRQLGLLTPLNGTSKDNILPLMGRPLFVNRNMWNYFTTGNQHNNIKLPVSRNGKSCTNEYGCEKLYNGDTVYIEGINEPYRVTEYDNETIRYLPFV